MQSFISDDKNLLSTIKKLNSMQEEQNSAVPDGDAKAGLLNTGKPELVVNIRGDISNSVIQTKESESKRSNSTCSESSNGDDTTPSDLLLPKTPDKVTKTSTGSRSCCSCSWWRYICSRVVFYGGQFWNKLVSCFRWMTGQCSSKKD
ncbi:uncharacterized protein LOC143538602 isoform X1 [Bidens hawaiensis]|uniref:uncharacterized protein LOC143538601 isoform X1 n=1 Tax=Bidens hawaiensis TaxID=980011 RepID=UPI00404B397D